MGLFSKLVSLFDLFGSDKRSSYHQPEIYEPEILKSGIVTLKDYWQERQFVYSNEWTFEVRNNATDLLQRVNNLLQELSKLAPFVSTSKVASGWRPREVNKKVGGAPRSYHITGQAIDLKDNDSQELGNLIIRNNHLLHRYQLWLENPSYTRGNTNWIHLDIGTRPDNDLRMFNP